MTRVMLLRTLSFMRAVMPDSNKLGAMVTHRMPYRDRSRVTGSVKLAIAPFLPVTILAISQLAPRKLTKQSKLSDPAAHRMPLRMKQSTMAPVPALGPTAGL